MKEAAKRPLSAAEFAQLARHGKKLDATGRAFADPTLRKLLKDLVSANGLEPTTHALKGNSEPQALSLIDHCDLKGPSESRRRGSTLVGGYKLVRWVAITRSGYKKKGRETSPRPLYCF